MQTTRIIHTETEMQQFAMDIAHLLHSGSTLGLVGELGSGKTTLTRFLVTALGGEAEKVTSPSFTLQNIYQILNGISVEHWDLYRLKELPLELYEPLNKKTIRIIEWSDLFPQLDLDLIVQLKLNSDNTRTTILIKQP